MTASITDVRGGLVSGAVANGLRLAVTAAAGLVVPPIMIATLGVERYGVFALVVAAANLVHLFDFGLQHALTKVTAERLAAHDVAGVQRHAGAVLSVYLAIGTLCVMGAWVATVHLVPPTALGGHAAALSGLVTALVGITAATLVFDAFQAVLNGLHRMDEANVIAIACLVVQSGLTVGLLLLGFDLWGVIVAVGAGHAVRGAALYGRLRRYLPGLALRPSMRPRPELRELLYLGSTGIAVRVGNTITGQLNKFLIAHFAGLAWVAYYDLASRVVAQFAGISAILFTPLVPAVSHLAALGDRARIARLTGLSVVYMNLLALPVLAFVLAFADGLVTVWLGRPLATVAVTIQVLIAAHYVNLLSGPAYHALIGLGLPRPGIWAAAINASLFCVGGVLGAVSVGYWGVIGAECLAVVGGGVFLNVAFHRVQRFDYRVALWRGTLAPASVTALSLALFLAIAALLKVEPAHASLGGWAVRFLGYAIVTIVLFRLTGVLAGEHLRRILTAARGFGLRTSP